jgi:hypothetical protein
MYGAREQLFADPGFALDQNRHTPAGKLTTPDCRLRCQKSIRAEGADVDGSPARKRSHASIVTLSE